MSSIYKEVIMKSQNAVIRRHVQAAVHNCCSDTVTPNQLAATLEHVLRTYLASNEFKEYVADICKEKLAR